MGMFTGFEILSSGMHAQRLRMNIISSNLANARTTRTDEGGPYQRREPVFSARATSGSDPFGNELATAMRGVQVVGVAPDGAPFQLLHDPGHPDANADGYVEMPNVNVVEEMVNLITASRSFEATSQAFQTVRSSMLRALEIGR